MCKCTPNIKTPFCGKPGCEWPAQVPSKELVRPLTDRLISACVAGCSCLTKTPDIQYHEPLCHYRLHMEAVHALNGLTAVYETFGIGVAVRTPSTLLENVKNAFRRSNCLSAIEREFFTKVVKDDDGEDIDECPLNWGSDPKQYVEQFRAALAAYSAHEPEVPPQFEIELPDGDSRKVKVWFTEKRADGKWHLSIDVSTTPPPPVAHSVRYDVNGWLCSVCRGWNEQRNTFCVHPHSVEQVSAPTKEGSHV